MKILIDNGHGVDTAGKRSPDGRLREFAYARLIAIRIVDKLREMGYDAERLVPEEEDISLQERCRRANEICRREGASNVLLISVHCNAAGDGSRWMNARGWEAWTSVGNTSADLLASLLYEAAEQAGLRTRTDFSDGDPDKEAHFYILKHTQCPAVLTENLFQDNREDVAFMLSDEGKEAITMLHVKGIISYIEEG